MCGDHVTNRSARRANQSVHPVSRTAPSDAGFTLVEILAAMLILAFGVTPPADVTAKGGVDVVVSIDYSQFRWALGAEWSQRLQLVEWQCDPPVAQVVAKECGNPIPLADVSNDFEAGTLTATVHLGGQPADAPAGASRAGLFTGDGSTLGLASAAGSFQATSLSNSGSWQVGGNNGSFSYSYPIAAPPAFNGLGPSVALSYDSSGVDGITSSVNSQAGEVGLGWSLSAGQGFIRPARGLFSGAMPVGRR